MKFNATKFLFLMEFLNKQGFLITLLSFLVTLPFTFFIFDGFKLSENKYLKIYQKFIFIGILVLSLILFVYLFDVDVIYCAGDSNNEDPHAKIIKFGLEAAKQIGDKLGDGAAAAAGVTGMSKLMVKSAPMQTKLVGLGLGAVAGVLGKRGAQVAADSAQNSLSSSNSKSFLNTVQINTDNNSIEFEYLSNIDSLKDFKFINEKTELFNNLIQSENDLSYFQYIINLFNSDNNIEVLLSSMLLINLIKIILLLLAVINLFFYSLSYFSIEMN
jgi:hypothetical protein